MIRIPFNKPSTIGKEFEYMHMALDAGHISGDGDFTKKCNTFLENILGSTKALLTTSGTHALEMTALLLDIRPNDEVIIPSFTFVSTVNAFALRGAKPIFVDIRPDTLNINEQIVEKRISSKTRAIVVVHYAGVACEMDTILDISNRHNLPIIEDNAHGLLGKYKDKYLGTIGCMAIQSFHETKNFSCGEGGALLLNDLKYVERAEIIREKGTDRKRFFRGQVDKYSWVDLGSSYLPSDMLAAFLYAQLELHQMVQTRRKIIWDFYQSRLKNWAETNGVKQPSVPDSCNQSYHLYYLLLPSLRARQAFISHLIEKGIISVFHYSPLHLSSMGQQFGGNQGDCPVTEDISDRLVRLPLFFSLTDDEMDYIVETIININLATFL